MNKVVVCTIVSKNYLSYARVFAKSFRAYHPTVKIFVLLADRNDNHFNIKEEPFEIIEAESLKIPYKERLFFQYNILELNTALKPFFMDYLINQLSYEKVLYFDPDILVFNKLDKLFLALDKTSVILTPHITKPIIDDKRPNEIDFLISGSYNLGFLGIRNTKITKNFLYWWKKRMYDKCLYKIEEGLFVDQKWIDLLPSLFKDYKIMYETGLNVAYWNLHERKIKFKSKTLDNLKVNNEPLFFFHFSGFDPNHINIVSKHQTRFSLNTNLKYLFPLFQGYKNLLYKNDYKKTNLLPYSYGVFNNNVKINNIIREIYRSLKESIKNNFGNPFITNSKRCYYKWLNSPVNKNTNPSITNLFYKIYQSRKDLQAVYPDALKQNNENFLDWIVSQGQYEYRLDRAFIKVLGNTRSSRTSYSFVNSIYHRPFIQKNKFIIKRMLGDYIFYNVRNLMHLNFLNSYHIKKGYNKTITRDLYGMKNIGLNIYGHVNAESGTGEAVRSCIKSIEKQNISFAVQNFTINLYRKNDKTYTDFSNNTPYNINLINVNADQVDLFFKNKHNGFLQKYNIGYWLWEQSEFPKEWQNRFKYFREIWASSSFAVEAISKISPIPVIKIPLAINAVSTSQYTRKNFTLPDKKYVFLFIFDFLSVFQRKNPTAVINAFSRAFKDRDDVLLIIKTVNSKYDKRNFNLLKENIHSKNIKVIDSYFSKEKLNCLINLSNCYVSLHRAEGFGYTIFESMYLEKPVIATAYSGNMDIMNINNSFPVKFQLKTLEKDYGPYRKGTVWADPDIEHAAWYMQYVYNNQTSLGQITSRAYLDVKNHLGTAVIGKLIQNRLDIIKKII